MYEKLYNSENIDLSKYLHIYAQSAWHDDAYLVGTKSSLIELRNMIDKVINENMFDNSTFFVNDGEGFYLNVAMLPQEHLNILKTPYTYEHAIDTTDSKWPHELIELMFEKPESLNLLNKDRNNKLKNNKILEELLKKYSEEFRHHHNLNHIRYCFSSLHTLGRCHMPKPYVLTDEMILAIWFHDSIYDPFSKTNEEDSVKFMKELAIPYFNSKTLKAVENLILFTKHDKEPTTEEEKLICDIDLSIFASNWEEFCKYDMSIRKEYAQIPDEIYYKERAKVLKSFLNRNTIYFSKPAQVLFENRAKKNLTQLLENMEKLGLLVDKI